MNVQSGVTVQMPDSTNTEGLPFGGTILSMLSL